MSAEAALKASPDEIRRALNLLCTLGSRALVEELRNFPVSIPDAKEVVK